MTEEAPPSAVIARATVRAYTIQGIVKYHGLQDPDLRLPIHANLAVCMSGLHATTTVEVRTDISNDEVYVNNAPLTGSDLERALRVIRAVEFVKNQGFTTANEFNDHLRSLGKSAIRSIMEGMREPNAPRIRAISRNSTAGKGLGFSAAGFAALAFAVGKALGIENTEPLIVAARLGAGSAAKSAVGGFSVLWEDGRAEQIAAPDDLPLVSFVIPIVPHRRFKTEEAHQEAVASPFYSARVERVKQLLEDAMTAIKEKNVHRLCEIAEIDSLLLHSATMAGPKGMVVWEPDTVRLMHIVRMLRTEREIPCWFSIDTGPSVFVNTDADSADRVHGLLRRAGYSPIRCRPAGPPHLLEA